MQSLSELTFDGKTTKSVDLIGNNAPFALKILTSWAPYTTPCPPISGHDKYRKVIKFLGIIAGGHVF